MIFFEKMLKRHMMLVSPPLDNTFPIMNNTKSLKDHKIQLAIHVLKCDRISHLVVCGLLLALKHLYGPRTF